MEASGCPCLEGNGRSYNAEIDTPILTNKADNTSGPTFLDVLRSNDGKIKSLLGESVGKLKTNTRKLVRRQIRRLNRLKTFFGWNLHYIDAIEAFFCNSGNSWHAEVVEPCVDIVNRFLSEEVGALTITTELSDIHSQSHLSRDLWSQYICEACGNWILRGAHEWEQHKQGC